MTLIKPPKTESSPTCAYASSPRSVSDVWQFVRVRGDLDARQIRQNQINKNNTTTHTII